MTVYELDAMQGLGPDSAACIRKYKGLARYEDSSKVKHFLAELIRNGNNKYLLLIITSGVSRIRNKEKELEILQYLYCSKGLAVHLKIYANTRCCYLVCDRFDKSLAKTFIARGYESLQLRHLCPPSDRSKWDPTHLGFSVILAMLNVLLVYGWLGRADLLAKSAFAEAGNIQMGQITSAFYGTTTRVARIIGLYYVLSTRSGASRDCAEECLCILRRIYSYGMLWADSSMVRYIEFSESLKVYRCILESLEGKRDFESAVDELIDVSILAKPKARRRVYRKLGYDKRIQP